MDISRSTSLLAIMKRVERSVWFQGFIISIIVVAALTVGAKTYVLPDAVELAISYSN